MSDLHFIVTPAEAGISMAHMGADGETPVFVGMTANGVVGP